MNKLRNEGSEITTEYYINILQEQLYFLIDIITAMCWYVTKLNGLIQALTFVILHNFSGSGIQGWLSWLILARDSDEVSIKVFT